MKEKLLFYLLVEVLNYAALPYEVYIIGFSFEQSIICRIFASLTDLIVVFLFFGVKKVWDPNKENKTIVDHLLAGVKLLIQFPVMYFLKVLFVNLVVIPRLQNWGVEVMLITQKNITTAVVTTIIFCLTGGVLYSIFRKKILLVLKIFKIRTKERRKILIFAFKKAKS